MTREKYPWIYDVLFLLVFALAGYLRLTGVDWGEGQHQHPDENTFTSVLYLMQAQKCADPDRPAIACRPEQKRWLSLADYFNSKTSTLNPYNIGFGSFVYGDLPMVMIRVAADLTNQINPRFFGRQVSAFADLFAILLLYLVVSNLYNRRVALLSALFSALAVMQIQQSHFFTIDLFVNLFSMLPIYFAVKIFDARLEDSSSQEEIETSTSEIEEQELSEVPKDQFSSSHESEGPSAPTNSVLRLLRHPLFLLSIG
jgi:hypothetical protein